MTHNPKSCSELQRDAIAHSNVLKAGATLERPAADALHAVRNGDAGQAAALVERAVANARHAFRNRDAGQAAAIAERKRADVRHAVRNGDAGQTGTLIERGMADARDLLPVIDRRDFDVGIGAGSDSENRTGSVSIGFELQTFRAFVQGVSGGKDICTKVSAVVHAVCIHAVVANAVNVAKVLHAVLDEGELVWLMYSVVTVPQDSRVITLCKSAKLSKEFGANLFAGAPVSVQVALAQVDANLDCGLGHKVLKFLIHGVIPFSGGVSRRVY